MRIPAFLLAVSVCASSTHAAQDTPANASTDGRIDERVQALIAKVKRSLRPLKEGTFAMGDWGGESGLPFDMDAHSKPLHKVTLDGFSMMAYKVTYEDFDVFTDATGKERINTDEIYVQERAPKRPAGVSWYGAKNYCQWLANLTHLPFELPTEAQWEYAARSGGRRLLFATDNGKIDRARNFPKEWEYGEKEPSLPDVGSFPPNPAGLYGMSENTQEWVEDWFDKDYYKISPLKNPLGPLNGTEKVQRGSVGGDAKFSAMVFMRTKAVPQTLRGSYANGFGAGLVYAPFPGFSGYHSNNFRCVLNSSKKKA